jgi:hypothetical protein
MARTATAFHPLLAATAIAIRAANERMMHSATLRHWEIVLWRSRAMRPYHKPTDRNHNENNQSWSDAVEHLSCTHRL